MCFDVCVSMCILIVEVTHVIDNCRYAVVHFNVKRKRGAKAGNFGESNMHVSRIC